MTRQGDLSNADTSTMQRLNPWYRLNGFPEGMLSPSDIEDLGAQAAEQSSRVSFGRFSSGDAAIGLVLGTILLLYLGTRVVVTKA